MTKKPKMCRFAIQERDFSGGCWTMKTACSSTELHYHCGDPYNTDCIDYMPKRNPKNTPLKPLKKFNLSER